MIRGPAPSLRPSLRVLHVLEACATGCARHVIDVVTHVPADHLVVVPSGARGSDAVAVRALRTAGARIARLPLQRPPTTPRNGRSVLAVRALMRRERPDVVHGHSSIGGAVARMAAIGTGVPAVYTPNALAPGRGPRTIERLLGGATAALVAVSRGEGDEVARLGLVPRARLHVIPNGIDPRPPEPADLRGLLGVGPDVALVGTVGRPSWQKATDHYVAACEQLGRIDRGVHFVLVGSGPDDPDVEAALASSPVADRFHWLPRLDGAARYLGDLTAFALPSRYEGGPYVLLEAIRAGVPVVASDIAGNRDVVEGHRTGLLVAPADATALAGALASLLDSPEHGRRLAAEARHRLAAEFAVETMAERLAALYQAVAAAGEVAAVA